MDSNIIALIQTSATALIAIMLIQNEHQRLSQIETLLKTMLERLSEIETLLKTILETPRKEDENGESKQPINVSHGLR